MRDSKTYHQRATEIAKITKGNVMTAKEIWYLWSGGSKLPEGVKALIDENGFSMDAREGDNHAYAVAHCCAWNGSGIVAYTLGETRERVECEDCGGKGKRKLTDFVSKVGFSGVCICCQGRGYIWKTEVAQ